MTTKLAIQIIEYWNGEPSFRLNGTTYTEDDVNDAQNYLDNESI